MTTVVEHPPPRTALAPVPQLDAPLPWNFFEFSGTDGVSSRPGMHCTTGHITADGHPMPFKFIQRDADLRRPVLLGLHGMGLTIATFRGISGWLFQTHDLLLPDYSCMTPNTALPPDASFKTMTAGARRIADFLKIERYALAGNSLGGGLCLLLALQAPERVLRMVLSNPACFPQVLPQMYRIVRYPLVGELFMTVMPAERFIGGVELIGYADKSRFDPVLRRHYTNSLGRRRTRFRLMQIIRSLPHDGADTTSVPHLPHLGRLTMPVLISWGIHDPLLAQGSGDRLAMALPNSRLEVYDDLAHMPHEERPDLLGPRWAAFLNE